jgi:hypothetical protein
MKLALRVKPVTVVVATALVVVAMPLLSSVTARPVYNAIMTYQYNLRDDKDLRGTCLYCHTDPEGGDSWNSFGTQVRDVFFDEGNKRVPETLYLTLKRNLDSDKDGYRDILEVIGKSFPGDARSKPEKSVEELEADLKTMGGLESFKPKDRE